MENGTRQPDGEHDIEKQNLEELHVLDRQDLEFLEEEFGIITVGMLLGKTRGLTLSLIVEDLENGAEKLHGLLERIPEEVLQKYREYHPSHPMGLLMEEDDGQD